jgi:hypothetical protein
MLYGSLWEPEDDVKANVGTYVDEVSHMQRSLSAHIADQQ